MIRILTIIAFTIFLNACVHQEKKPDNEMPKPSKTELVDANIEASAKKIENLWSALGRLEQSREPGDLRKLNDISGKQISSSLQKPVTIYWSGDLGVLVHRLAKRISFDFKEIGVKPSVPIYVSINAKSETVAHVLRNAGYQAGNRAGVVVYDAPVRRLEIVYEKDAK